MEYRDSLRAKQIEFTRYFPIADMRAEERDGMKRIAGYAAVFNSRSEPLYGMFREVVRPGAFTKTLQESDVIAFWNHDDNEILGRRSNQALTIREDPHGLPFELALPDTTRGRDAWVLIQRKDVSHMSFGFRVIKEAWTAKAEDNGTLDLRELLEVNLVEISPVIYPAYRATEVEARTVWERRGTAGIHQPLAPPRNDERNEQTAEPGTSANHSDDFEHEAEERKRNLQLLEMET